MLSITPAAAAMVRQILDSDPALTGFGLRIGIRLGGCAGKAYHIEFMHDPEEGDIVSEIKGVKIFVSPKALDFLEGVELDFETGQEGAGFRFNTPNADPPDIPDNSFPV